ncbi:endolytic transglycosylase MltG [Nonomuraea typhae]|uniref:endolytic transglycosylase MltG n=1 Tax=Nonomuraea typhae TaxID=2603600 RepID=UPI0012FB22F1|nr:endolytic transglycosylase MltG [Nonomuraea typhae]
MNELDDMDFLLGSDDDNGRSRRQRGNGRRGRRRRRRRNRGGFLAPLLAIIVLLGIVGGGGYYGYLWLSDRLVPEDFPGPGSGEVALEIKSGQTATDVAEELVRLGIIKDSRAFVNAITNSGKSASLVPGHYTLRKQMRAADAVTELDSGNRQFNQVTLKEGLRLSDTIATLAKETKIPVKDLTAAAKKTKDLGLPAYAKGNLEGYAFPATYQFPPKATAGDVFTKMVDRFKETADRTGLESGAKALGRTPGEIVIIASIIQAEAGRQEDMGKISRVIYNRLNRNPEMKLQMDSTVMYALGKYGTAATFEEAKTPSPYNTYKHLGLPPGAISSPGDHAIEAALNPTEGTWLFFVATDPNNSRVTKFATTEAERQKLLQEYKANGG